MWFTIFLLSFSRSCSEAPDGLGYHLCGRDGQPGAGYRAGIRAAITRRGSYLRRAGSQKTKISLEHFFWLEDKPLPHRFIQCSLSIFGQKEKKFAWTHCFKNDWKRRQSVREKKMKKTKDTKTIFARFSRIFFVKFVRHAFHSFFVTTKEKPAPTPHYFPDFPQVFPSPQCKKIPFPLPTPRCLTIGRIWKKPPKSAIGKLLCGKKRKGELLKKPPESFPLMHF